MVKRVVLAGALLTSGCAMLAGIEHFSPSSGDGSAAPVPDAAPLDVVTMPSDATGDDTPPEVDAFVDGGTDSAVTPPSCVRPLILCGNTCLSAESCANCPGAPLFCRVGNTCVTTCDTCVSAKSERHPIECFSCEGQSGGKAIGTCEPQDGNQYCLNGQYGVEGFPNNANQRCPCGGGVGACPGEHQVCATALATGTGCATCGESNAESQGLPCKNGKTCNTLASPPRCE